MENLLDGFANSNAMREVDTRLKLILGTCCILLCAMSPSPITPFFIGMSMGCAVVFLARIPGRVYLHLLAIPVSFAATSSLVILFLSGGGAVLGVVPLPGYPLMVTTEGASLALLLLSRTFGGMGSLYFIALTTPMVELFAVMQWFRLPKEFIDLSMLIYRYIFILIGEAIAIHNAQELRHGYMTLKSALHSLSMLGAMLFIRSWNKGEELLLAMDTRCYAGKLAVLQGNGQHTTLQVTGVILFLCACCILTAATGEVTLL